ncbi:MAG: hypothetical protein ABW063_00900 [Caulobacter sp.]
MLNREDRSALDALSDALADAASLHRRAAEVADSASLQDDLTSRAERLQNLSANVRGDGEDRDAGSPMAWIDRLRLTIDQWFEDKDEAASAASRDAKDDLLRLIDGYLRGQELSSDVRSVFETVRQKIAPGRAVTEEVGLKALPT